jgi:hypothetical protein
MEVPSLRRIVMSFVLIAALYAAFLAGWMRVRGTYARAVAATATHQVFPLLGMEGGVQVRPGAWIQLDYTVPDKRTGEWGRMPQRFLDFSDIPLAAAASLGLLILGWRRRLIVLGGSVVLVALCHLSLIVWSAHRFQEILGQPDLDPGAVEGLMTQASTQVTGFGNLSSVVTLFLVGVLTAALGRIGARP